jgi:predicted dehydrogenase
MSAAAAQQGPRYRILGTAGAFTKGGMDVQEDALRAGMRPGDPGWGEDAEDRWGMLGAGDDLQPVRTERGAYDRFYPLVADAIERSGPPPVDPRAAIQALAIIEAARLSNEEGRVVRL